MAKLGDPQPPFEFHFIEKPGQAYYDVNKKEVIVVLKFKCVNFYAALLIIASMLAKTNIKFMNEYLFCQCH